MALDIDKARAAIASIESAGSGDYSALGPITKKGDRAYGRYQVMGANLPQWTQEALGRQLTPEQFQADKEAQDAVFAHRFGKLHDQYGNVGDAASAWFTGRPQSTGGESQDQLGTSGNQYVNKFMAAYNGGQPRGALSPNPDAPAPGAQEAQQAPQGIMTQAQQMPQESMGDSLGRLSAAFFRRDSPQTADGITSEINTRMGQHQAFMKAQQASNSFKTSGSYKTADGRNMVQETLANGQTREREARASEIQAEDPAVKTRQEVVATEKLGIAENTLSQLDRVRNSIATLREGLQHGSFNVGPDENGKMVVSNIMGNSTESGRYLKAMESQIIEAATAMAATQKGSLTNFKFAKDIQAVMPGFANFDRKAAYEALERVSHGLNEGYTATANTALNHAKGFERLQKKLDPTTGEDIDINKFYRDKIKDYADRESKMTARRAEFMAQPGRGQSTTAKPQTLMDLFK